MTFYIIVVDFTDYIITNYLLKNSSFNNFYLNYLNSFLNFGVMNNFVKLNDFVNGHLRKSFLLNTKNQKILKRREKMKKNFLITIALLSMASASVYSVCMVQIQIG